MNHVDVTPITSGISHDPLPGTEYRAVRRIGGGATSEVFEAIGPDRARYAVKVLRSALVHDRDAVFCLREEASMLTAIDHPNVMRAIDSGTTASWRPFLVMPLLAGETARDRIRRRGPVAPLIACAILADVLAGLEAAHALGIVHRNLEPASVFLPLPKLGVAPRRAVLLDFGAAKVLDVPGRGKKKNIIVGAPGTVAPEQILGGVEDACTDVYAAGMTLFAMIAGRYAFDDAGCTVQQMRAHLETPAPSLADFADVSPELAHVVARAIAKSPSRRWPGVRAFAAVLDRAMACERARRVVTEERAS